MGARHISIRRSTKIYSNRNSNCRQKKSPSRLWSWRRIFPELAGLNEQALNNVFHLIMNELMREMGQHGLHPTMIADPLRQRIRELEDETLRMESQQGYRLGGVATNQMSNTASGSSSTVVSNNSTDVLSARELAWAAAERRAREQKEKEKRNDKV